MLWPTAPICIEGSCSVNAFDNSNFKLLGINAKALSAVMSFGDGYTSYLEELRDLTSLLNYFAAASTR